MVVGTLASVLLGADPEMATLILLNPPHVPAIQGQGSLMGPSARRGRGVIGNVKAIGDINHTMLWGVCITQPHPTTSSCDGELREDNGEKKRRHLHWGPGSPWGPF